MLKSFSAIIGHILDQSWTDRLVGLITLIVIIGIGLLILWLTGTITFGIDEEKVDNQE